MFLPYLLFNGILNCMTLATMLIVPPSRKRFRLFIIVSNSRDSKLSYCLQPVNEKCFHLHMKEKNQNFSLMVAPSWLPQCRAFDRGMWDISGLFEEGF